MSLYCAKCGYDVKGIRGSACPECGARINRLDVDTVVNDPGDIPGPFSRFVSWALPRALLLCYALPVLLLVVLGICVVIKRLF